jgi:hypothetical protein
MIAAPTSARAPAARIPPPRFAWREGDKYEPRWLRFLATSVPTQVCVISGSALGGANWTRPDNRARGITFQEFGSSPLQRPGRRVQASPKTVIFPVARSFPTRAFVFCVPFVPDHRRLTASRKRSSSPGLRRGSNACARFPKRAFLPRPDFLPTAASFINLHCNLNWSSKVRGSPLCAVVRQPLQHPGQAKPLDTRLKKFAGK